MSGASLDFHLPPGFRFHPTDEELVNHYLCRKCAGQNFAAPIIAETDLYKYDPWELPQFAPLGEKEWYFFSPRERKYPNGSRPNRAAGTGYWKATGADKPIGKPSTLGIKKSLVFYVGKAPNGLKTNWIMHEYRLANVDRSANKRKDLRLDDWVLCRLYNKKGILERPGYEGNASHHVEPTSMISYGSNSKWDWLEWGGSSPVNVPDDETIFTITEDHLWDDLRFDVDTDTGYVRNFSYYVE